MIPYHRTVSRPRCECHAMAIRISCVSADGVDGFVKLFFKFLHAAWRIIVPYISTMAKIKGYIGIFLGDQYHWLTECMSKSYLVENIRISPRTIGKQDT